jgi:hypothetical protein
MNGISHPVFSSCTNTKWVRDPWLGRVGIVEVKALVASPLSPCSSMTVQAPWGRHTVPLMMSLVRLTFICISPTELNTRTVSPDRSPRSSPFIRLMTNMLNAGIDKTHRDVILGHALQGMDVHYISLDDNTLKEVIRKYTRWLDEQVEAVSANLDQSLDQAWTE